MYKNIKDIKVEDLKKNFKMIHYFGLGFIQLKIDDKYRLHFYTNKLPKILDEEEIHNHRYSFTSYILKGNFSAKFFKTIPGDKYVLEDESCKEADVRSGKKEYCDVVKISEQDYSAGDKYWLEKDVFHRVQSNNCVTLVEREIPSKEFAEVLTPVGKEKICPFSKKVSEDTLWGIVEEMLK